VVLAVVPSAVQLVTVVRDALTLVLEVAVAPLAVLALVLGLHRRSANDADVNDCPFWPVMSAPAAFVGVGQFFSRWSQPCENVATGHFVLSGSNTPGTSAALADGAKMKPHTAIAAMNVFFDPCAITCARPRDRVKPQ
jgi:hypothetical protein